MSATNAPFGLRPAYFPTGLERAQALANGIASGYSSNILKGQPVIYNASAGTIVVATAPAAGASAASYPVTGSFQGVEWTDTTGRRRVSNYWPANTSVVTGSVIAYFYNDLNIVYEIQADGPMAQTTIGNEYNFSNITAGSTTTGLSQATLSATGVGNGVQGQMRVVDIAQYPDNAWGDAYTIVRVQLAITQFYGAYTAIA
jgi:hypothetical protein